jgi:tRNA pseudouridine38-40 synthase
MTEKKTKNAPRPDAGESRNIKLTLEYEGTNYHGWQTQTGSGQATVQETLEKALSSLTHGPVKVNGSSRTDAGVHALGYVCNVVTGSPIPPAAWAPAMNHVLPEDIRVLSSEEAAPDFHARFSSVGKIYSYRILNRRAPSALYRHAAWHVNLRLNMRAMRSAAEHLTGQHDFSAFRAAGCSASTPVRTLKPIIIRKSADMVEIRLEADSFPVHGPQYHGTGSRPGRFRPEEVNRCLSATENRPGANSTGPWLTVRVFMRNERVFFRTTVTEIT